MANLAKNRQRAGENLNEIKRGTPCKEEKLTKMANLAKILHGFGQYSFWTPKVHGSLDIGDYKEYSENQRIPAKVLTKFQMTLQKARPLKMAISTKMANVGKICQGLDYMSNKKAKGLPDE